MFAELRQPPAGRRTGRRGGLLRAVVDEFCYGDSETPVLAGVDLSVRTGELVVVAGPSGSGKSTLALALAGLIPGRIGGRFRGAVTFQPDGGSAVDLGDLPLHVAAQHVGIVFQNPEYQLIQYQVDAEVAFGPENLALDHAEVVDRVARSLELTGVGGLASAAISSLSGGQKQRVAIAAALAMQPPMLVLDEPTSDLDPVGTEEVLAVLSALRMGGGCGVVVVEHKLDEVARHADRIVLVVGGRVVLDEPPRVAFLPSAPWREAGVRPPELALLAEVLPRAFRPEAAPIELRNAAAPSARLAEPPPDGARLDTRADGARLDTPPVEIPGASPELAAQEVGARSAPLTVEEAAARLRSAGLLATRLPLASPGAPDAARGDHAAFEVADVEVAFKDKLVLRGVDLRVEEGEGVALVGANGSGKTTLGSVLMGFVEPRRGSAACFGRPVEFGRIPRQAEHVGYLFQNVDDMLFTETVAAELDFTRKNRVAAGPGAPTPGEVAELIGLSGRLGAHPYELSGGERQRLALGALLTRAPRGLILDEPTTGLDEAHAMALFELLSRVRESLGALSCLLITHDMRLVARFADRVVALRDGRVVLDAPPCEAFAALELLESSGVRPPAVSRLHASIEDRPPAVALGVDELAAAIADALGRV